MLLTGTGNTGASNVSIISKTSIYLSIYPPFRSVKMILNRKFSNSCLFPACKFHTFCGLHIN